MKMLLETGIPKLDELLEGGIEQGKSVLFYAVPGVRQTEFAQQLLYTRLNEGDKGIYFVNNKRPEIIRHNFKEYDWNLNSYEKHGILTFFDCYSNLIGMSSEEPFFIADINNLSEMDKKLMLCLKQMQNQNTVLVFDALSSMIDLCGEQSIPYIEKWLKDAKKFNVTPVFLFTEWPYDKKLLKKIRGLFDCIVDLKAIEQKVILRSYFAIAKASWLEQLKRHDIPFKITCPGGVKVYIPKILVTGPYNAGKTSFVHSASIKAVSVDRVGTTIALDHGHVDYKGFTVDLWGTPGQERFDPILELLGGESVGVVIIIDSTDPKGFERAREMLELTRTENLPAIVVANKANLKEALKPEQIRKKIKLPKEIPIVPVIAEDLEKIKEGEPCKLKKEDVNKVLNTLFERVLEK